MSRAESSALLMRARAMTTNVSHRRLGAIGRIDSLPPCYALKTGEAMLGRGVAARLPFVVEAWAADLPGPRSKLSVFVNRTPIVADMTAFRDGDKDFLVDGCGLCHLVDGIQKTGNWTLTLNVSTPFMPITSDGKTPDLEPFVAEIVGALASAIRQTRRARPKIGERLTATDVFLDRLDEAIANVSGEGAYRFPLRQLFYALRPFVIGALGVEPGYPNFEQVITNYERAHGEILGLYREPRGTLTHPHTGEADIEIGTLAVESYERPPWLFNKVVVIEKAGFAEALRVAGLPKKFDFVTMTNRGFTGRALKDLIDQLAERGDEPLTVLSIHDADAAGTMIHQTLVQETLARGARKVGIIDLGLNPWEAEQMRLASETVKYSRRQPVADYVRKHAARSDGQNWADWLQGARYELNSMTMPQFLAWLERKLIELGGASKVVPPQEVAKQELSARIETQLRERITERILREAGIEGQIDRVRADLVPHSTSGLAAWLGEHPGDHWRTFIDSLARAATDDVLKIGGRPWPAKDRSS
jgi:hypothetical protein